MIKSYFIPATKINARISETVLLGYHIKVDGLTDYRLLRFSYLKTGKIVELKLPALFTLDYWDWNVEKKAFLTS